MNPLKVMEILGGHKVLRVRLSTDLDLVDLEGRGLPRESLTCLAGYLGMSTAQMSHLLPVAERTIQRYTANSSLSRGVSGQVLALALLVARGIEVFGEREPFLEWIARPSTAFGARTPLELMASQIGIDLVADELGRIEHGIVS